MMWKRTAEASGSSEVGLVLFVGDLFCDRSDGFIHDHDPRASPKQQVWEASTMRYLPQLGSGNCLRSTKGLGYGNS